MFVEWRLKIVLKCRGLETLRVHEPFGRRRCGKDLHSVVEVAIVAVDWGMYAVVRTDIVAVAVVGYGWCHWPGGRL